MDDKRLETIIGNLLRAGVLLAAAVVLAGGALYLVSHHADRVNFREYSGVDPQMHSMRGVVASAAHWNSQALIQLGLLLLIATPVARVAMAVVGFTLERDRLYAVVSLIVLAILAFSLMHAV